MLFHKTIMGLVLVFWVSFPQFLRAEGADPDLSETQQNLCGYLLRAVQKADLRLLPEQDLRKYGQLLIQEYEKAPEKSSPKDLFGVACAYGYLGDIDRSLAILVSPASKNPGDRRTLFLEGRLLLFRERYAEAVACFKQDWLNNKDDIALPFLAMAYLRMEQPAEVAALVPAMMERRNKQPLFKNVLLEYSLAVRPVERTLMQKALEGMDDNRIRTQDPYFIPLYVLGFWTLDEKGRALKLQSAYGKQEGYDILTHFTKRRQEVIDTYEREPGLFGERELKVVGICYILDREFEKARIAYERYVKAVPDDGAAWRGIGFANFSRTNFNAAIEAYRRGWALGDWQSLKGLAAGYLGAGQLDALKGLVPDLLKNKDKNIDFVKLIVAYALTSVPPDKEVFFKAIAGVKDIEILNESELAPLVIEGLRKFGDAARADALAEKLAKTTHL